MGAQQMPASPDTTIRTITRVVLLDAIVTDAGGQPVPGLTASDFTVLEDGKPQKIAFFSFESPARRQSNSPPPRLRPGVYTNRPEYRNNGGPLIILLMDGLNTPPGQQIYVRQQILKYLAGLKIPGPGTAVLALGNELSLLQDSTTDSQLLVAAVRNYTSGRTAVDVESPAIDVPVTTGPGSTPANVSVPNSNSADPAANIASQTNITNSFAQLAQSLKRFDKTISVEDQDFRVRTTLTALRAIGRALSGYPGRKSLVWFSAGFPFNLALDESMDLQFSKSYREQIRQTAALLSDASVAVYPIDARGLLSSGRLSDPTAPSRTAATPMDAAPSASLSAETWSKFNSEATMDHLARDTGGEVFRNTNDLNGALRAAIKDSEFYYALGFYPERKVPDGRFHSLKVVLANKQLKVRSRTGYYALDPSNWRKAGDTKQLISPSAMHSLAATGLLFYAHVGTPEKKGQPITVEILVDSNTVSFGTGPEFTFSTDLEFQVGAFTPQGKLEHLESQAAQANLRRDTYDQMMKNGIPVRIPIMLKRGRYLLRVAARDNRNGHTGTLEVPLDVQ